MTTMRATSPSPNAIGVAGRVVVGGRVVVVVVVAVVVGGRVVVVVVVVGGRVVVVVVVVGGRVVVVVVVVVVVDEVVEVVVVGGRVVVVVVVVVGGRVDDVPGVEPGPQAVRRTARNRAASRRGVEFVVSRATADGDVPVGGPV
ncbi:MAG: hypothetical protein QF796_00610 [Acidimicrobiales bacterium]|nr:hypothetical protein [Acidimicrobiales bacterium]